MHTDMTKPSKEFDDHVDTIPQAYAIRTFDASPGDIAMTALGCFVFILLGALAYGGWIQ